MKTYPLNGLKVGESLMIPWEDSVKENEYMMQYIQKYIKRSKREFHLTKCKPCLTVKRVF